MESLFTSLSHAVEAKATTRAATESGIKAALPRQVDLGADKCIPCKAMAPILEELKQAYAGRMEVEFIDVRKNSDALKAYMVAVIPTQIFYDASGKDLDRHTGFFAKEDIPGKWKERGVELAAAEKK
ncbi:MAG: thioredoxin family protein [Verrucomicrobiota bacterium]